MNFNFGRSIIVCVFCSFASISMASAATHDKEHGAPSTPAGKEALGATLAETQLIGTGWLASKLIGTKVYNETGDKIGEVDDVIVTSDGKLSVAIVEVGGFLGMGKRRVAIPVRQFTQIAPTAILPGSSKETLKKLPVFVYSQ